MKIRGIKRGKTIELLEQINSIPDGTEIVVDLEIFPIKYVDQESNLINEDKLTKLNQLFGNWKDQPELEKIFAEIDQQRHAYQGRNIKSLDT